MRPTTHSPALAYANHQAAMCTLLGIDAGQYNEQVYQTGITWLGLVLNDAYEEHQLAQNSLFWNWWRNELMQREAVYTSTQMPGDWVVTAQGHLRPETADYSLHWHWLHCPRRLADLSRPDYHHLLASFEQLCRRFVNRKKQAA